jgi:hypothetical protein
VSGALDDAREAASIPVGVRPGGDTRTNVIAQLLSIDTVANRALVSVDGSQPIGLPYNAGATYTGFTTVMCLRNPIEGRVVFVLGPVGTQVPTAIPAPPPPPAASVTASATILPTASATWSAKYSRFAAWQPTRYGGSTTLYQGNQYGSGVLTGIAVYGDQILNLGATSITAMTVGSTIATPDTGSPQFQGTAAGTLPGTAPTGTGGTASGTGAVDLVASGIAAAMLAGTVKGLVLVGGTYLGIYGAANSGMALNITYTRPG